MLTDSNCELSVKGVVTPVDNQLQMEFERVLRQYGDNIYHIALLHTKNNMDAQDIVQEVFLKYAERQDAFESDEHRKAWLIRVTVNMCKNLLKSSWFKKTTDLNEDILPTTSIESEQNTVVDAVMKLPEKYRDVIHLFYFEGYSIKEISDITGQKVNAVKTQLSRARNQLKNILKGEFDFEI